MPSQTINISLPSELLKKVDEAAKNNFSSRSDYIRQSLVSALTTGVQTRDQSSVWQEMNDLADEISEKAAALGYTTDDDFVNAIKETRRELAATT